jgi:23S rRNA (uracil1939-C5)-methyltransferase
MSRRKKRLSPDPFELDINELGVDGCGRAEHEGRLLRVHGALAGERVEARYLFGRKFRDQAETLSVLAASSQRTEPRCPNFGTCSACSLQHQNDSGQLGLKQAWLLDCLDQFGEVRPDLLYPPLTASPWNYRRKARLSVRDVPAKGRVLVGFREKDGRFVADMQECHVLAQPLAQHLANLSALIGDLSVRSETPQIEVSCGDHNGAVVIRHLAPMTSEDIVRLGRFSAETGLAVWLQSGGPDTVSLLAEGNGQLSYRLPEYELEFRFGPLDFIQVNGGLNRKMVSRAVALLKPEPTDNVLDLFCGQGNFSLPLARSGATVTAIEGDAGLVQLAGENARRNGLENVTFLAANLYAENVEPPWQDNRFDKVLLDPPRSGAAGLLPALAASGAKKIVYVSCNPETFGRDAGALVRRHGFTLAGAGIMDMFPHTRHVESIGLFQRD